MNGDNNNNSDTSTNMEETTQTAAAASGTAAAAAAGTRTTITARTKMTVEENESLSPDARFVCNICFDAVQDPVVTQCGHLYCWPCLYRWFEPALLPQERESLGLSVATTNVVVPPQNPDPRRRVCPVCKSPISLDSLVPIYVEVEDLAAAAAAAAAGASATSTSASTATTTATSSSTGSTTSNTNANGFATTTTTQEQVAAAVHELDIDDIDDYHEDEGNRPPSTEAQQQQQSSQQNATSTIAVGNQWDVGLRQRRSTTYTTNSYNNNNTNNSNSESFAMSASTTPTVARSATVPSRPAVNPARLPQPLPSNTNNNSTALTRVSNDPARVSSAVADIVALSMRYAEQQALDYERRERRRRRGNNTSSNNNDDDDDDANAPVPSLHYRRQILARVSPTDSPWDRHYSYFSPENTSPVGDLVDILGPLLLLCGSCVMLIVLIVR